MYMYVKKIKQTKQKSNIYYTESHSHTLSLFTHTHTHTHHAHIKLNRAELDSDTG